MSQSQKFGLFGEKFAISELNERGLDARLLTHFNARYDVICANGLPIEVKVALMTSRSNNRIRWQFKTVAKLDVDYIFILIAIDENGELFTFIIPSSFIGTRQSVSITSHPKAYSGMWAGFLNAWQWINEVMAWRAKYQAIKNGQLSLFGDTR